MNQFPFDSNPKYFGDQKLPNVTIAPDVKRDKLECLVEHHPSTERTNGHKSRVVLYKPARDEQNRRFVPYCDFGSHQGPVVLNHQLCEHRTCRYYRRLYLNAPESP